MSPRGPRIYFSIIIIILFLFFVFIPVNDRCPPRVISASPRDAVS